MCLVVVSSYALRGAAVHNYVADVPWIVQILGCATPESLV